MTSLNNLPDELVKAVADALRKRFPDDVRWQEIRLYAAAEDAVVAVLRALPESKAVKKFLIDELWVSPDSAAEITAAIAKLADE